MQHSFDISIAQKYGVNVAIFLNNIAFWIHKNLANNKHFYDGRYWTYNSQEAFTKLFPYWTRQNLRTIIKDCVDQQLILTGNFNETKYDRTSWYALTDLGMSLFPTLFPPPLVDSPLVESLGCFQPIKKLEPTLSLVGTNQPIPDSKPDLKTYKKAFANKTKNENQKKHDFAESMEKMANEKKHIEEHEVFKRSPMPESLRNLYKSLTQTKSCNKYMDGINTIGREENGHGCLRETKARETQRT